MGNLLGLEDYVIAARTCPAVLRFTRQPAHLCHSMSAASPNSIL